MTRLLSFAISWGTVEHRLENGFPIQKPIHDSNYNSRCDCGKLIYSKDNKLIYLFSEASVKANWIS